MSDEIKLEIAQTKADSSPVLSKSRSSLVARGCRDAEFLAVLARADAEFELTPEPAIKRFSYLHVSANGKSVEDVQKCADTGDPASQYLVADAPGLYKFSDQPTLQKVERLKWFQRASERGYAPAQCRLGMIYDPGLGNDFSFWNLAEKPPKDIFRAVYWYTRAAEQGFCDAAFNLGSIYATGDGLAQDYLMAAQWYIKAAERGLKEAQYNLGLMRANGYGSLPDFAEASKWYRLAADQGLPEACFNLGVLYRTGRGVKRDSTEAARWFLAAAEGWYNAKAEFNIGLQFYKGDGVVQDYVEAYKWFHLAVYDTTFADDKNVEVEQKYVAARNRVSARLTPEEVVEALRKTEEHSVQFRDCSDGIYDYGEAERLFRAAAEKGNADAQCELGLILRSPSSFGFFPFVERNYADAARWLRKSADQGNVDAQYLLGHAYLAGEGVPQDYLKAYFYFSLAASGITQKSRLTDDPRTSAVAQRDDLARKMTLEQIAQAQKLANLSS